MKYFNLLFLFIPISIFASNEYLKQDLSNKNFVGQNLSNNTFINCILNNTDFSHANLANAQFKNSDLTNTSFRNAVLDNAYFNENNIFKNTDFRKANLNNTIFDISYENLDTKGVLFNNALNINNSQFKEEKPVTISTPRRYATSRPIYRGYGWNPGYGFNLSWGNPYGRGYWGRLGWRGGWRW